MTNENEEDRIKKIKKLLDSEADTRPETPIEPSKDDAPYEGTTRASVLRRTPTPPERGQTPPIALDKDNMPLPRRVDQVDMEGTRVSPTIYGSASRPRNTQSRPANAS